MSRIIVVNVSKAEECLREMSKLKSSKAPTSHYEFEAGRAPKSFYDLANDISALDAELTDLINKTQDFLSNAVKQYKAQDARIAGLIQR